MCNSAPKQKPIASAPIVGPEVIDDVALNERDRERQRNRQRNGRQSTIITGDAPGAAIPTAGTKTALGI